MVLFPRFFRHPMRRQTRFDFTSDFDFTCMADSSFRVARAAEPAASLSDYSPDFRNHRLVGIDTNDSPRAPVQFAFTR
jgi:hypothetical protein